MYIFTSFGFRAPIVREKLKDLLDTKDKSVLILPFVGFNTESCAENEKNGLIEFGFDSEKIFVCAGYEAFACKYDYIYVPGGYTFKLLAAMQSLNIIDAVRQAVIGGATYIGVSAGAEVASSDLEYVKFFEDNDYLCADFIGLSLVDEVIIPHSDQHRASEQMHALLGNARRGFLMIPNNGVILYELTEGGCDIKFI